MKFSNIFLVALLITFGAAGFVPAAEWTFMVYLDADNDLEPWAVVDFVEMATVGSNADVNIVVQMDMWTAAANVYGTWTDTRRGLINTGDIPDDAWGASIGEANMGDPATLTAFVNWGITNYPAANYAVILWDHGSGWRAAVPGQSPATKAIAQDVTDGNDWLQTAEVGTAFAGVAQPIQVIGFDACSQNMLEIAHEIRNEGEVMVGSEKTEPGAGWPYDKLLAVLAANPGMDAAGLGTAIVEEYGKSYNGDEIQSALDLTSIGALSMALSDLAGAIITADDEWFAVYSGRTRTTAFDNCVNAEFRDLGDFLEYMAVSATHSNTRGLAAVALAAYNNAVIANYPSPSWPGTGIAIYFPDQETPVDTDYNATVISFAADTQWDEMLAGFGPADTSPDLSDYKRLHRTNFEDGLPADWSVVDGSDDTHTWNVINPAGRVPANVNGVFAIVDSDWAGAGVSMDEELISPVIDCSDAVRVVLKFKHFLKYRPFNAPIDEYGDVDIRIDSAPWQNVLSFQQETGGTVALDITALAYKQQKVQIRFRYHNADFDWYWAVDDVEIWGDRDESSSGKGGCATGTASLAGRAAFSLLVLLSLLLIGCNRRK